MKNEKQTLNLNVNVQLFENRKFSTETKTKLYF